MDKPIRAMRKEYAQDALNERDAGDNPLLLFDQWFDAAVKSGIEEPNGMALATVDKNGRPSARVLLLKGVDARGFLFFTSYDSRKGVDLSTNPYAAMCFWWGELERQVRIEGTVERISSDESDAYFSTRPRESQFGAAVSAQSAPVASREVLETDLAELRKRVGSGPIPRPSNWGGYRLSPQRMEFWQGRSHRLHDRLLYSKNEQGEWTRERLSP